MKIWQKSKLDKGRGERRFCKISWSNFQNVWSIKEKKNMATCMINLISNFAIFSSHIFSVIFLTFFSFLINFYQFLFLLFCFFLCHGAKCVFKLTHALNWHILLSFVRKFVEIRFFFSHITSPEWEIKKIKEEKSDAEIKMASISFISSFPLFCDKMILKKIWHSQNIPCLYQSLIMTNLLKIWRNLII